MENINKEINEMDNNEKHFILNKEILVENNNLNKIDIELYLDNQFFSQKKVEELAKKVNSIKLQEIVLERKFIYKVINHIEIIEKKNSRNSLYDLFTSSLFGIDLMIYYLDKYIEPSIIDTLINQLYKNFVNESFFYLPQLCTMLIFKPYVKTLENYILDICVDQMKFSLMVHWLVLSYYENADDKIAKVYGNFLNKIEETIVNGKIRSKKLKTFINDDNVYKNSIEKQIRLKYFDIADKFYIHLREMCEKLKEFPKDGSNNRNTILKSYIYTFNQMIINNRTDTINEHDSIVKFFYKGFILPFDDSIYTSDEYISIIVRFIPDHSFCFSTKARVPVKLCAECITINECFEWDLKYKGDLDDITCKPNDQILLAEKKIKPVSKKSSKKIFTKLDEYMNEVKNDKNNNPTNIISENSINETNFTINIDSINPFGKIWIEIQSEIKEKSPYKNFESYTIKNFIAKANDDLRQELMAMQLIKKFYEIFKNSDINLKLRPYEILITSSSSGLIEFLPNTNSIDGVKKKLPPKWNLNTFYRYYYKDSFEEAQKNFAESLAAYSLVCYFLQIKDRHNGNILLDMKGNIIHIDFGFILGISPGNLNFETAPFKLTIEYVEILDGLDSPIFEYFKSLILRGFLEAKKHLDSFVKIVEIMSKGAPMPCFENADVNQIINKFSERFHSRKGEAELIKIINDMIYISYDNFWTNKYDSYQKLTNGILP